MTSTEDAMFEILKESRSIALVGVSPRPDTPSYAAAAYLQSQGYNLIPVTDGDDAIVGFATKSSLNDVSDPVDVMSVFLTSEQPVSFTEDAARLGVKAIWVEPGCSQTVTSACEQASVPVYSHHSIMTDHQRLLGKAKA